MRTTEALQKCMYNDIALDLLYMCTLTIKFYEIIIGVTKFLVC